MADDNWISGDEIKARGHSVEHKLAEFIRAHQKDSSTHVVNLDRLTIGNIALEQTVTAYNQWEKRRDEINATSPRPEAPSDDLALIRMNNLANFINTATIDAGHGQLYVPDPAARPVFESLVKRAEETHKDPADYGIVIQPIKPGRSR